MATNEQVKSFIKLLGGLAVAECNRRIANGEGFVLPSVVIAQSALETGYGTAGLMTRANAFFGIKAGGSWTGAVYTANTKEVKNGVEYNTVANFRAYDSLEDSVRDYFNLIVGASRYSKAICYGLDKSKWLSARQCVTEIWRGGYATDELYVQKIMNMIEPRNMTEWDNYIDGVSNAPSDVKFTGSDFVQGALIVTDSGRSIGFDGTATNSLCIPWDKRFKVTKQDTYVFHFTLPATFYLALVSLKGDVASVGAGSRYDQYTARVEMILDPGEYSFNIRKPDGVTITPADVQGVSMTLEWNDFPGASEVDNTTPLAQFVKIE